MEAGAKDYLTWNERFQISCSIRRHCICT